MTSPENHPRETRLKKLRIRAWRRGTRELDMIVGPFADAALDALSDEDLSRFEALLDAPDQDLFDWILGRKPPPPEHDHAVTDRLRAFRFEAFSADEAGRRG